MQERLLIVYYGVDRLPYKDENREVHFPIVSSNTGGTIITGENNTSKLYFYVGRIGGGSRQWIANIKKPDGTLSYLLCSNGQSVNLENGETDYRVSLDIASLVADQVGDVYIGLQGYSGDTVIVENDGTYEISGNPIVLATGTIKIKVNYAPNVLPKGETLSPTSEQLILAALGDKMDKTNGILVVASISGLTASDYENYQVFYSLGDKKFYRLVSNEFVFLPQEIADDLVNGVDLYSVLSTKLDKRTTTGAYAYAHIGSVQSEIAVTQDITGNTGVLRRNNGNIKVPTLPSDNNDATSMSYVKTFGKSLAVSIDNSNYVMTISLKDASGNTLDTKTVDLPLEQMVVGGSYDDTTESIILTLQNGNTITIPVHDLVDGLVSESTYNSGMATKVNKTSETNKVYGTDGSGNPKLYDKDDFGKVDDVKVNGTSVVTSKIANIDLTPFEEKSNKVTSLSGSSTDTQYPSAKAVYDQLASKEDKSNKVTSLSQSSTNTQYPSAKCVYDELKNVREVAEGKTNSFILSYSMTIAIAKAISGLDAFYVWNSTTNEWENKKTELLAGDYDELNIRNSDFNSNSDYINKTGHVICGQNIGGGTRLYLISLLGYMPGSGGISQFPLKNGDNFLVIETNVPDRWWSTDGGINALESKSHLSGYVPTSRTIAGVNLVDDITSQELTDALVFMNDTTDLEYVMED